LVLFAPGREAVQNNSPTDLRQEPKPTGANFRPS
jgi:hypothetical protein